MGPRILGTKDGKKKQKPIDEIYYLYIFKYTSTKYIKIRILLMTQDQVFGHQIFLGAGCPGLFFWEYSYGPGSGFFCYSVTGRPDRAGPDGLGRQAQRTGAVVAAAVVLKQRQEAIAACRIRSFFWRIVCVLIARNLTDSKAPL